MHCVLSPRQLGSKLMGLEGLQGSYPAVCPERVPAAEPVLESVKCLCPAWDPAAMQLQLPTDLSQLFRSRERGAKCSVVTVLVKSSLELAAEVKLCFVLHIQRHYCTGMSLLCVQHQLPFQRKVP